MIGLCGMDWDHRVSTFVQALACADPPSPLRNPYRLFEAAHNLEVFLRRRDRMASTVLLVGEAPGHRGAAVSGVPLASLPVLLGHSPDPWGAFGPSAGYMAPDGRPVTREATAAMVWRGLAEVFGDVATPLTWNAVPFHPAGATDDSNSSVTSSQLLIGRIWLEKVLEFSPNVVVVAVGRAAEKALSGLGVAAVPIRHPSHGGGTQFLDGLRSVHQDYQWHGAFSDRPAAS